MSTTRFAASDAVIAGARGARHVAVRSAARGASRGQVWSGVRALPPRQAAPGRHNLDLWMAVDVGIRTAALSISTPRGGVAPALSLREGEGKARASQLISLRPD